MRSFDETILCGEDRNQVTLFPEVLDDYIAEENPVRVVDVFIDNLDLKALGFDGVAPAVTGRPSYHPSVMLKLYVYGYLNRIQSSRRLEREAQINECLKDIETADRHEPDIKELRTERLQDKIAKLKTQMEQLVEIKEQLNNAPDNQISKTDPDARSMRNRGSGLVGYNVQTAVDSKHHLIVEHDYWHRPINAGDGSLRGAFML